MFATLRAQHLQMGALEAAAKAALSPNDFDVFCAAIRMTDSVQTPRNHLAHWIWGTCEQLPDALLLADPKGHQDRDRELKLAFERAGGPDVNEIINLNRYVLRVGVDDNVDENRLGLRAEIGRGP